MQTEKKNGLMIFKSDLEPEAKKRGLFWLSYFVVCFLAQIWPIYLIANRVKPYILGMPFSMFWIGLWIVIIFVGLVTKYKQEYGR